MLLRLLASSARPYTGRILAALALQLTAALATLLLPGLNADIIDHGVAAGDAGYIWRAGAVMLAVALGQGISAVAAVWFGARISMGIGRDLRARVYRAVDGFGAQETARFGAATLITRGTNDVQQVQMVALMGLNLMVNSPLMVIGGIIMALRQDVGLSWLVAVAAPTVLVVMALMMFRLVPLFGAMQARIDAVNGVVREQVIGIRVVRAFVREQFETRRFADANQQITDVSLRIGRIFVLMGPVVSLLMHAAEAAVMWFGGQRADAGQMEVGSLTAFMQYMVQILTAVLMASFVAMMLPRAMTSARRIGEVLDTVPAVQEPAPGQIAPAPARTEGVVEFREVGFAYPGAERPVLEGVSFTARPGGTTAVVGSTGSGKSTLLQLVPRLFDAVTGTVSIDGRDVRRIPRAELARTVGMVPQKPYLFSGTVASNLRLGRPEATDAQLWAALETAQAADFVRGRGEEATGIGLDSPVAQGGTDLSGGQRQRLCIARTLVAEPAVYLFDDSFSALDVATDARLRAALAPRLERATVLVVAQRVSTVRDAEAILVLDGGRVVARGTHEELLVSSPTYREIVSSQLQTEEDA